MLNSWRFINSDKSRQREEKKTSYSLELLDFLKNNGVTQSINIGILTLAMCLAF